MGSVVAGQALGCDNPQSKFIKYRLEDIKGHEDIKQAAQLMQQSPLINYIWLQ